MRSPIRRVVSPIFLSAAAALLLGVWAFVTGTFPWYQIVLAYGIAGVVGLAIFLLVWFELAPRNLFFTFVSESTAKIIVKGDQFSRCLIQWDGYTLDREWNVIRGREPWHPFGGLRFYGIWPVWAAYFYRLRWNDIHRSEERAGRIEQVRIHDEELDYVLLRQDVYWTKLSGAETTPEAGERIPLDVEFNVIMQVTNPYKAAFVAPQNWVENVMVRLDAVLRGFVANRTLDQLLAIRGGEADIWSELGEHPFIQRDLREEWGILIPENGIQIKDIGIPADVQQAAQARRTGELRAEGERQKIRIEAEAEALRIDTVYGAIARHPLGSLFRTLEALEKSPLAASVVVQAVPGLQEILRGAFGRPPAETPPPAGGEGPASS